MTSEYKAQFESFVAQVMKEYDGQGIGIIGFDQEQVLYEYYSGYRNVEKKLPINRDTIFGIASITKSFTVMGILQLADKGIIDIHQPITKYLDHINLPAHQIPTVAQLMSHSAGFYPQERFLMKDVAKTLSIPPGTELCKHQALSNKGLEMIINRINQMTDFCGLPGENHSYSNFSFGLLTALLQKYGGEAHYSDYIEKHILDALELKNTFLDFNRTKSEDNITMLYEMKAGQMTTTDDYEDLGFVLLGGGALKSSLNDLMTYTRLYLNDGNFKKRKILSPSAIMSMQLPRVAYKPFEGYGYGLLTGKICEVDYAGHSGGLTGVSSYFIFTRETQKGIVVLCNTSNVPVHAIGLSAIKLLNGQEPTWMQMPIKGLKWSRDLIEKTIGSYKSEEGGQLEIIDLEDTIAIKAGNDQLNVTPIDDNHIWVHNKMLSSYTPIFRDENGHAKAIYSGARIIKRV